tara:strand:+ start:4098 stop:4394 length:297 start_codon:yes stop_codon:yes gene_type:complete
MLPLKPKTVLEQKQEKEQEQKKLIKGKFFPGMKLFAFDVDKKLIYEVDIEDQEVIAVYGGKEKPSSRKASINPNHPHLWALNLSNAKRKFFNKLNPRR